MASRRWRQTALYHIAEGAGSLDGTDHVATADEIWGYLPGEREKYVFTANGTTGCLAGRE